MKKIFNEFYIRFSVIIALFVTKLGLNQVRADDIKKTLEKVLLRRVITPIL